MDNINFSLINCNQLRAAFAEYFEKLSERQWPPFLKEYYPFLVSSLHKKISDITGAEIAPTEVVPNPIQSRDEVFFWRSTIGRLSDVCWSITFSETSIYCRIETPHFPENREYLEGSLLKADSNIREIVLLHREYAADSNQPIDLKINGQNNFLNDFPTGDNFRISGQVSDQISIETQIDLSSSHTAMKSVASLLEQSIQRVGDFYLLIAVDSSSLVEGTSEHESLHYPEGALKYRIHIERERNPEVIRVAKEKFQANHNGRLLCEVCSFDFQEVYGDRGQGYAEGHHKFPVAEMSEDHETTEEDIAIVCANCHRMLHREPFCTVEQLRDSLVSTERC